MKSLTIYLHEEDYEKVKQSAEKKRISVSHWYRELTKIEVSKYDVSETEKTKSFSGIGEEF
ncbi:MAG: hypothetical protein ACD_19C00026G0001 [uncultured bacterium]|nr:MAG: hypothetical protein ACD_19C00026G0001 [uncultured bacterium]